MTRHEFASVMAYISAGIGKPIAREAAEVYFDLLGDLPEPIFRAAAKRVLLEHKWATFPSVAELREAAALTMQGEISSLTAAEAWQLAWKATGKIDPEVDGSLERACAQLPPLVFEAMRSFGIPALCFGREPVAVVRAQFMKFYEQLADREKRRALLPDRLTQTIRAQLPGGIEALMEKVTIPLLGGAELENGTGTG